MVSESILGLILKSAQWFVGNVLISLTMCFCIIKDLLNKLLANQNLLLYEQIWGSLRMENCGMMRVVKSLH